MKVYTKSRNGAGPTHAGTSPDVTVPRHLGVPRYQSFDGPVLFSQGFRPFFLGAGFWGGVAVLLWVAVMRDHISLPTAFTPLAWHSHEMIFGFAAAAVAGFMLTAIPNWTGRMPLQGLPLIILFAVWFLGRVVMAISALTGPGIAAVIDLSFLGTWRAFPMTLLLTTRHSSSPPRHHLTRL